MNLLENITKSFSVPLIELNLSSSTLKKASLPIYDLDGEQEFPTLESEITYYDDEQIRGEVTITPETASDYSYHSIEVHLIGILQTLDQRRTFYDVSHVIDGASTIVCPKILKFKFGKSEKPYETFYGRLFQVRYFLEVSVIRNGIVRQTGEFYNIFIFKRPAVDSSKMELFDINNITKEVKKSLLDNTETMENLNVKERATDSDSDDEYANSSSEGIKAKFFNDSDKVFISTSKKFPICVPYFPIDSGLFKEETSLSRSKNEYTEEKISKEQYAKFNKMFIKNELYLEIELNKSVFSISEPIFGSLYFKEISIPFSKVEVSVSRKEWLGLSEEWLVTVLTKREIVEGVPFPGDRIPFRIDTRPIKHMLTCSYDIMRGEAAVFYCMQVFLCDTNARKLFKEYMIEFKDHRIKTTSVK
eukprot:GAHX01000482.1.p1 GENE.GAHX01000482.1~~GAHX01000482.1.p1  ORF type:complete len:431 (+),score=80.26 GAHX01000482.1:44-1294(+)